MKKLLLLSFVLFTTICFAQTQKSHFLLHPNEISFNPLNSSTVNGNTNSYIAGNSVYNRNGNLLFYVYDGAVYNSSNSIAGSLSDYYSAPPGDQPYNIIYNIVEHEIAIVPFNQSCDKFYVIYLLTGVEDMNPANNAHQALMYSIVDVSGGSVSVTSSSGTSMTQLLDRFGGELGGIAVSPKISDDAGRFLFCVAGNNVNRYRITDSGITFENTIEEFQSLDMPWGIFNFDLTELELFWKETDEGFIRKLGWGSLTGRPIDPVEAHAVTIELDQNGESTGNSVVHIFEEIRSIVGFEFAPEKSELFFISAINDVNVPAIYYYDEPAGNFGMAEESEGYWSHIELARDGRMYIAKRSNGELARFDPLSPSYSISSSFGGNVNVNGNNNDPFVSSASLSGFYTLPDQIDGENNVFYPNPVSDFTISGGFTLPTNYPGSGNLPTFYICDLIKLEDQSLNGHNYRVTINKLDMAGDPLPAPTQAWTSSPTTDLKAIEFDGSNMIGNPSNYGEYMITFEVKTSPCQIIDSKVGYFEVTPPNFATAPMTINGSAPNTSLPTSTPFNLFSCSSTSAILDDNGWNADFYKVSLLSVTSSGTPTPSVLNTNTAWESNFSSIEDLKNLPAPNGTWLANATNAGYYKVTLEVGNLCNNTSTPDIIDEYTGYVHLNAPPSPANMNLNINNGLTGLLCNSKSTSSMCLTGNLSGAFSLGIGSQTFSSNNIESFKRKIERVNCTSGFPVSGTPIFEDTNPVIPSNPNAPIVGISFAGLSVQGDPQYFVSRQGDCFKLTVEVFNPCSNDSDWTYFQIDPDTQYLIKYNGNDQLINAYLNNDKNSSNDGSSDLKSKQKDNSDFNNINTLNEEIAFFPNPVQDKLSVKISGNFDYTASIQVLDQLGRHILNVTENKNYSKGVNVENIDVSGLSNGIYFLSIIMNGERTLKKVIKQ